MKLRKSSLYTVRSGSWKAQMGISRGCSLLPPPPPLEETWDRARETMLELAWEMPLDRRFSAMRNGGTLEYTQLTQRTFHSGKNHESHWLPNTTTLFFKPNTTREIQKVVFLCTHTSTKYTFLSTILGIFQTSSPHDSFSTFISQHNTFIPSSGSLVTVW